jgi:hypothetical protein
MATPKYLEAFRRAAREAEACEERGAAREAETREKSELSEKRGKAGGLISLNTLISPPEPSQNPPESDAAACAVCGAADDLWRYGEALVHQECARFLPKPEPAESSLAYEATSADPAEGACSVQIVELPQAQRYRKAFTFLQLKPPALVPVERWRQCVEDGKRFLAKWGEQAEALNWSSADLFGLHTPPDKPHATYNRLSRYDCTGLVWQLKGREVVALTEATATIRNPHTGAITTYRRSTSQR